MDAQLIEKLDRRRYKYLLWQTIGFALFFPGGMFISSSMLGSHALRIFFALLTGIGAGIFVVATFKNSANERQIKRDPELKNALNDELVRLYGDKSLRSSFFATLITAVVLFFISDWWPQAVTANFTCLIIIYIAVMTQKISQLIYLRR